MLLLHTTQRRSDVVHMGRQHVRNDILSIVQQKTGQDVHIPLHDDLKVALDALALGMTFSVTAQGKLFRLAGFTNWFRAVVREAALPDGFVPHGLNKAVGRRLAEAGCSEYEIIVVSGHNSTAELNRYSKAAGRKDLATRAMLALGKTETKTNVVKPAEMV